MGSLFRRGDSPYWWLDYVDHNGRRVRRSSGTPAKAKAQALLTKLERDVWEGKHAIPGGQTVTVGELKAVVLAESKPKRSYRDDVRIWGVLSDELGSDTRIGKIGVDRVVELRDSLSRRKKQRGGRNWSVSTVNRHLAALRRGLNIACREGWILSNPASHVKLLREPEARDRIASEEEIELMLSRARTGSQIWLAILLGVETGMSQEEIVNLRREQVDFRARMIRTTRAKTQRTRRVPIPPRVREALASWDWQDDGRAFTCKPVTISRYFSRVVVSLGLVDLRFHDLRHTYATRLRREGHDLLTVMRAMGHSQMSTAARYQTVDDSDLMRIIASQEAGESGVKSKDDILAQIQALMEQLKGL